MLGVELCKSVPKASGIFLESGLVSARGCA